MSSEVRKSVARPVSFETKVSRYDRVSALLTALVILLSAVVLIMFLIWLTDVIQVPASQVRSQVLAEAVGDDERPEGEAQDIEEPGSEFPEVETPQLSDSIEALTTAVSSVAASDQEADGSAELMGEGRGVGTINGGGLGDGRVKPPWERWELRYTTSSKEAYAAQLDHFQIELGGISRETADIVYLENLSGQTRTRNGSKGREKRVFFNYNEGSVLGNWDQQFMADAGINTRNRILVQFYPPEVQNRLATLEKQKLGTKSLETVYRTVYGVRPSGDGYEYYVIDQIYR